MDDTVNKQPDKQAEAKEAGRAKTDVHVQKLLKASDRMKEWYLNYVLSDFTFASFAVAILAMIKIYLNLNWTSFWNGMMLFYIVFISTMLSRLTKVLSVYYEEKTKNLRRF